MADTASDTSQGKQVLDAFRRIVQALRQASKDSEKQLGLSAAQLFVLRSLGESRGPLSVNQLAELTGTHQSSVSVVVKKLVELGLLSRKPAQQDARSLEIALTAAGEARLKDLPPLIQDRFLAGLARMTPTDRAALVTGLQAFVAATELTQTPPLFFEETP